MEERDQLRQSIGEPKTVVEVMLRRSKSWDKIACNFRHVITNNTENEAVSQRMTNNGPSDYEGQLGGSTREEMCVPVSARVNALDGGTQMRINCRA